MANPRLDALFQKFLGEEMTAPELRELQQLIISNHDNSDFNDDLDALLQTAYTNPDFAENSHTIFDADEIFTEIMRRAKPAPVIKKIKWFRWVAAASVVLLVSLGSYFIFKKQPVPDHQIAIAKNDIVAPNINRARITLANGQNILIDSVANGTLVTEGNTKVEKLADGQIVYNEKSPGGEVVYNTLFNPRGSKPISILLADGTTVWLNAESSLKYPVAFSGNERKVEITGEGYFEVAHDTKKPFIVSKNEISVAVLGTHFNVDAYDDNENIKVTLLEGSVKVTVNNDKTANNEKAAAGTTTLKPGDQAKINSSEISVSSKIDLDQVMAWKNGKFSFDNTDLATILKEFSRWYDVKVVYEDKVPDRKFFGIMNRSSSLATVLSELQANNIKFELEGKVLSVK